LDIAGQETDYPPDAYAETLKQIWDTGIHLTTHYGESGPPEYPRRAIELLRAERLGHGVSVADERAVTELAAERGVTLEMCPTSNWLTRAVRSLAEHPARRLLGAGVLVTLNTDDPGLFGVDLTHELEIARDELGFGSDDLDSITRTALAASFLPTEVVDRVRARHFSWLG